MGGGNSTKPETELAVIHGIYTGRRKRAIKRETKVHDVTLGHIRQRLDLFLACNWEFPKPLCACGNPLWHQAVCPVWDTYSAPALAKGHETQGRLARERHSTSFFEANFSASRIAKIKGPTYKRLMEREAIRRDMLVAYYLSPDKNPEMLIRQFEGRGFNRQALSTILRYTLGSKGIEPTNKLTKQTTEHADTFFQSLHQASTMSTLAPPINTTLVNKQIEQFTQLVQRGIDAWTEAGRLLVKMIEDNPNAKAEIVEACPDITEEILSRFEAIGRNQLHPKTLLNNSPGMRRLRSLPFSDQTRYLNSPVPVLVRTESGVDTLQVAVQNLTHQQALQVFASGTVRSPEAQRAYLESRRAVAQSKIKTVAPYVIKGGRVTFNAGCEMSARELATILAQLS